MQLYIKKRDGPARIGKLLINNKNVLTPNILFINTTRFKPPDFADLFITNQDSEKEKSVNKTLDESFSPFEFKTETEFQILKYLTYPNELEYREYFSKKNKFNKEKEIFYIKPGEKGSIDNSLEYNPASFFIIENTVQLFHQQFKFIDFISELREKIGNQKIIYTPCIGDPTSFALLSYIGIDFFDSISAILAARKNNLLFSTGELNINDIKEIPCSCPICCKYKENPKDMDYKQILYHNYFILSDEIRFVRNAINNGNLRELVDIRVRSNSILTSLLRILDQNHYEYMEKRIPITRKNRLIATTNDALYRAEVKRYKLNIINKYKKPEGAKILLLLPCSAKKPYSFSKSHLRFKDVLDSISNKQIIHEVIITSPLGIVPRELELIYPASSYDIPVTGFWDEDEKKMIQELLLKFLVINRYEKIILHLPKILREILIRILKNPIYAKIDKSPTSNESLEQLSCILRESTETYKIYSSSIRRKENMESLASYQFGNQIAKELLKNCQIKGKYPYQKIIKKNKQLGMTTMDRGFISLTMDGAKILAESKKYWVEIYDDFELKGSVFAPGIKDADESIRICDEVVVLRKNKLYAVGVAQMNGIELKESTYGEAVKIRHRI